MQEVQKGYVKLVLYSILAGIVGVFVKLTENLDAASIVFFRAAIAVAFIFILILFGRRIQELAILHPGKTLLVGLFQGLSFLLYIGSLLQTTVSNAVFLLYTAPIFSVILARFFLKEEIEKETFVGIFITLLGIILILNPTTFSFDSSQAIGNLAALGAGFFYAAMAVTAKPIMEKKSGYYVAFWQYLLIALMFIFFLKFDSTTVIQTNWWQLAAIGIVSTAIPFILFYEGVKKVKAQKIFIITALEPLAGTVLALFVLHEVPSLFTLLGAFLILYGVYRITK